ncbi:HlyD family efflux transporter periplasmic adaptor subunit [Martelella sp. HB161492]|uniref:HlyD family secretion protein n=1 Tax=Martelella sp. HB161492 TaxID=2720726 RepID=UPI001591B17A|nr:HlyD family efflux transporter periplasmic adaptor subunit [Martelella sp. HB161492]
MKRFIAIVAVLVAGLSAALYFFAPKTEQGWLGYVEADMLYIGAPSTARLTSLSVTEGDEAQAGQVLFTLESTSEQAAVDTAEATLARQQAALSLAKAPQYRPEELQQLQAAKAEAEAALTYAKQALERARALYQQQTGTKANLDNAVSAFEQAKAALDKINAQIALGKLPQRDENIAEAEQAVSAARSDLAAAKAVVALKTISAPAAGSVQETYYRTGEVAPAGRPIVALLPPGNINIEFFVPEGDIASLKVGDKVALSCDGCNGEMATVSFMARSAEYTPPEIFSREERAKMVYRLKAKPDNPRSLPVGLPVSVSKAGMKP